MSEICANILEILEALDHFKVRYVAPAWPICSPYVAHMWPICSPYVTPMWPICSPYVTPM